MLFIMHIVPVALIADSELARISVLLSWQRWSLEPLDIQVVTRESEFGERVTPRVCCRQSSVVGQSSVVAAREQDNTRLPTHRFAKRPSNTGKTSSKYPVNYHNQLCMQMQHKSGAALIWRDKRTKKKVWDILS